MHLWEWPLDFPTRPFTFIVNRAVEVRAWAERHLLFGSFGRDDYRELCELVVHYLGGQVMRPHKNRPPVHGFEMRKPGALHHARFLASCLYILKLSMLADALPQGTMTPNEREKVDRLAQYIALFHAPYFLQASLASAAPRLDITLWQHMSDFSAIDPEISAAVQASIKRQQWYLTQECVVLSLFDDDLGDETRRSVADALLAVPNPGVFLPKKPDFPTDVLELPGSTLASFVGPRSWLPFQLLSLGSGWLLLPVDEWVDDDGYKQMASIMRDLAVVNDTAERSLKDIEEYANAAHDGEKRGKIILVSNSHRFKLPEFLKNEMENNI